MASTRILVADDHPIVLAGLRRLLDAQEGFAVVAEATDGIEAVRAALAASVDLAILDVSMPRKTGLQAARDITRHRPGTRVLMLSMHADGQYVYEALAVGASGYVLKTAIDRDLIAACRAALRGEPFLYPDAERALLRERLRRGEGEGESGGRADGEAGGRAGASSGAAAGPEAAPDREPLTPRELEVVKLIAEAYSNDEIAEQLVISKKTVERHRANILDKLGMRDRVELTRFAIRRGLVEP
jgi:DNA-binding NarL/FixJ family response regulator